VSKVTQLNESTPSYSDLKVDESTGERTAWGVFGQFDQIGTLNHLTDERVVDSVSEVRSGRRFSLNLPVNMPNPPVGAGVADRHVPTRRMIHLLNGNALDDQLDGFWLQGSTQWDGLSHVRHRTLGFYNGASTESVEGPAGILGIQSWQPGVVGRGVLVDVARWASNTGTPYEWDSSFAVTPSILKDVLKYENVELRAGDILMLRTGWLAGLLACSLEDQARLATTVGLKNPGLYPSEEMISFLWDSKISAIAADNSSVELTPPQKAIGFGHWKLIPLFGFALGELWWLEDLADDCAEDGRYTSLLVSVPLNVPSGCGSPANAIAIK